MIRPLAIMAFCSGLALAESPGTAGPVVLELFTSASCPTCPPVDQILGRLRIRGNVVILSEHVDYWDSAGKPDPFASPLFSTRQLDYASALQSKDVYTPQIVVNGEKALPVSNPRALHLAISAAAASARAPVSLKWVRDQDCLKARNCSNVALTIGHLPPFAHRSDVLLVIAERGLESSSSQDLRDVSVVRTMMQLAEVDPAKPGEYSAEAHLNFRTEWVRDRLMVVVLVQDRQNRRILGANWIPVPQFGR